MILINTLFIYYYHVIQSKAESEVNKQWPLLLYNLENLMIHSSPAQLLSKDMNSVMNAVGQKGQRGKI